MIPLRMPQNAVPNAKVWMPDAAAKKKGAVLALVVAPNFTMPVAPPKRKPAVPVMMH